MSESPRKDEHPISVIQEEGEPDRETRPRPEPLRPAMTVAAPHVDRTSALKQVDLKQVDPRPAPPPPEPHVAPQAGKRSYVVRLCSIPPLTPGQRDAIRPSGHHWQRRILQSLFRHLPHQTHHLRAQAGPARSCRCRDVSKLYQRD